MSDFETYVMILGANLVLFTLAIGGFAGPYIALLAAIMFGLILWNLYKISPEAEKIRVEILKNKKLILKQKRKLEEQKGMLARMSQKDISDIDKDLIAAEVEKMPQHKSAQGGVRLEHWKKLEKELVDGLQTPEKSKLEYLANKKNEIHSMLELSKKKYHQRVIDEQSYREITKDYQQKLIEVEAEIEGLKGKKPKDSES